MSSMIEAIKELEVDESEVFLCGVVVNSSMELVGLFAKRNNTEGYRLFYRDDPYGNKVIDCPHGLVLRNLSAQAEYDKLISEIQENRLPQCAYGIISGTERRYGLGSLDPVVIYQLKPYDYEAEDAYNPEVLDTPGIDAYDLESDDKDYADVMENMYL